ncbi:MAG: restriction endonuclease subunit S [Hyphomicrobiales bacterium]
MSTENKIDAPNNMPDSTTSKYPKYKNSNIKWLGEIPEHWEVKRFKYLSKIQKGKLPKKILSKNILNLPPYLSMEYLRGGKENQWVLDNKASIIDKNEILLLWDGSNAGEFLKSRRGVISSTVAHINYRNINKEFAWFYAKVIEIELKRKTIGMGIPHVNGEYFNNLIHLLPPLPEQTAIATYLDEKSRKIEQAISQKQKLIELLKERKQIMIQNAVTGASTGSATGPSANSANNNTANNEPAASLTEPAEVKDSGIEWIGKIPKHWEVKAVRRVLNKLEQGDSPSPSNDDLGIFVIKLSAIKEGKFNLNERKPILKKNYINKYQLKKGDFLLTRGNTPELVGDSCFINMDINIPLMFSDLVYRLTFNNKKVNDKFMLYSFLSEYHRIQIISSARGSSSSMVKISQDHIKSWTFICPPLSEQQQIADYIERESDKIDKAISIQGQQIEKLREYKLSLINSVVTGKLRVCK